jgi:predicted Zn finger-like uncharacterized protein
MILTCPACFTRYQADAAKFPPAGRDVRCAKCGHVWHQLAPEPEIETEAVIPEEPAPAPKAFVAPHAFVAPQTSISEPPEPEAVAKPERAWLRPAALAAGWVGLIAIILVLGTAAASYRHELVAAWPQSASLYAGIGMKTNASGFQFNNLAHHEESEDNQLVLVVTGTLVNISRNELPVPQIRVSLSDNSNHELYHWIFAPDVTTLGPGQSVPFVTRISSPPAAARHLDVRFAKAGE